MKGDPIQAMYISFLFLSFVVVGRAEESRVQGASQMILSGSTVTATWVVYLGML